ncbi:MAG: DUF3326 domain-containing protein [Candidatus Gastranaerophilales bacterium]|nr:DUF3326 domain-containing protein [Candidatus Gastranaerophilales bacterium]
MKKKQYHVFNIPTGIGAKIGGFAGDAGAIARKFAKHFPLIVNPNVVNAACFSAISKNMQYVEGYALTEFFKGNISLKPSKNNKIGIIFDRAISKEVLNIHINTINAIKTVYGINVIGYEISKKNAGVEFFTTENGISSGRVNNPETLLEAGKKLIKNGADVLAVVCKFEEAEEDGYADGESVDVVGGAEAIISHFLSKELCVPVVHAPAFEDYSIKPDLVHPKAAAEYITPTFLPCLLFGLENAPLIVKGLKEKFITINDVKSLIMPYNSLGSSIVTNAIKKGIIVMAIKENSSVLNITKDTLLLKDGIIETENYFEGFKILKRLK